MEILDPNNRRLSVFIEVFSAALHTHTHMHTQTHTTTTPYLLSCTYTPHLLHVLVYIEHTLIGFITIL